MPVAGAVRESVGRTSVRGVWAVSITDSDRRGVPVQLDLDLVRAQRQVVHVERRLARRVLPSTLTPRAGGDALDVHDAAGHGDRRRRTAAPPARALAAAMGLGTGAGGRLFQRTIRPWSTSTMRNEHEPDAAQGEGQDRAARLRHGRHGRGLRRRGPSSSARRGRLADRRKRRKHGRGRGGPIRVAAAACITTVEGSSDSGSGMAARAGRAPAAAPALAAHQHRRRVRLHRAGARPGRPDAARPRAGPS